jgi:hypothetical protein
MEQAKYEDTNGRFMRILCVIPLRIESPRVDLLAGVYICWGLCYDGEIATAHERNTIMDKLKLLTRPPC